MSHEKKKYFGGWILTAIVAVLLIAAIALTIVAVGPSDGEGVEKGPLKLGILLPLSGDQKTIGDEYLKGIELAIDDLKKNGTEIEPVIMDTESNSGVALDKFLKMKDLGITTIIGPTTANAADLLAPYAEIYNINLLTIANTNDLDKYNEHVFKYLPKLSSVASAIHSMITKLEGNINRKEEATVCIVYDKDSYGYTMKDYLVNDFNEDNAGTSLDTLVEIPIPEDILSNKESLDSCVNKIKEAKPLYVCVLTTSPEKYILLDNAAADDASPAIWIGTDYILTKSIAERLKNVNRTVVLSINQAITDDFRNKYTTRYGTEPGDYSIAVVSYDVVSTLGSVIPTYGTNANHIAEGLKKLRKISPTGLNKFDENGYRYAGFIPYVLLEYKGWVQEPWSNIKFIGEFWNVIQQYQ